MDTLENVAVQSATRAQEILARIRASQVADKAEEVVTVRGLEQPVTKAALFVAFGILARAKATNLMYNDSLIKKVADQFVLPYTSIEDIMKNELDCYPKSSLQQSNACICGLCFGSGGQLVTHCPSCEGKYSSVIGFEKFKLVTHFDLDTLRCRIGFILGDYCINQYAMYSEYRYFLVKAYKFKEGKR